MLMRSLDDDMITEPLSSPYAIPTAPGIAAGLRAPTPPSPPVEPPAPQRFARADVDEREPSPTALETVQVAARAFEELRASGRELRFAVTDSGMLKIEVYDGTGQLVRRIPANEALALASGEEATWLA